MVLGELYFYFCIGEEGRKDGWMVGGGGERGMCGVIFSVGVVVVVYIS